MQFSDFRSDTLTKPSKAMREAMAQSEVGDDVFREDPTVNALEERIAQMFQKEAALFFPTGTMANLTALMTWCDGRGSEVIRGASFIGGVAMRTIPNQPDGTIKIDSIVNAIRANNIHYPVTRLVCLENTQNYCGGRLLPKEYLTQLSEELRKHRIPLHIDGARIWNASVASNLSVAEITKEADSVSVCMSKGLGAPCGSLLVGGREWIEAARRIRKALGGGMRQVGVLAAACHVALDDFETGVLRADHERATRLATALSGLPRLQVHPQDVDSNILVVHVEPFAAADGTVVDANTISGLLKDKGILCIARNPTSIRLVTHRDLTEMDIDSAIDAFKLICAAF